MRHLLAVLAFVLAAPGCAPKTAETPAKNPSAAHGDGRASATTGTAAKPAPVTEDDVAKLLAAQVRISSVMALALRVGTAVWQTANPGCPKASDVVAAHMVPDGVTAEDAWGTPFRIVCGKNPTVISAGPDGAFDTPDDILAGDRPVHLAIRLQANGYSPSESSGSSELL